MDALRLKLHAELLEEAISRRRLECEDAEWLAQHLALLKAIDDAKSYKIFEPRKLGLDRWEVESNIRQFNDLPNRLIEFEYLLEGREIPSFKKS